MYEEIIVEHLKDVAGGTMGTEPLVPRQSGILMHILHQK